MNIILIGPSGAGKGSLAEYLVRDYQIPHISTGQIFRDNIANKTALGIECQKYVSSGTYVPDEITVKMLLNRIAQSDCENGFILDGFPRTINQAKLLVASVDIDQVIEINATDETVIARLGGRYMCEKCNTIHNKRHDNIKKCKSCGAEGFYQREDDREESILKRLSQYRTESDAILEFFGKQGNLITLQSELEDTTEDLYKKYEEIQRKTTK